MKPIRLTNSQSRYGLVSQSLHWLMAVLIVMQFTWAWRIQQLDLGRLRYELVNQHKSIGLTIFAFLMLRLFWRWFNPPPPPVSMPRWQQKAMHWVHGLIYLLLLLLPPIGWAMSSAAGFVVSWFDIVDLPALVSQDDALKDRLRDIHALLAWSLAVLVSGHIAVALYHHFVLRDQTLRRMLPGRDSS